MRLLFSLALVFLCATPARSQAPELLPPPKPAADAAEKPTPALPAAPPFPPGAVLPPAAVLAPPVLVMPPSRGPHLIVAPPGPPMPLPASLPPGIVVLPNGMPTGYYRQNPNDVWQGLQVGYDGRFRRLVYYENNRAYYAATGQPYPWWSSRSDAWSVGPIRVGQ